jgi:hypothetical protein
MVKWAQAVNIDLFTLIHIRFVLYKLIHLNNIIKAFVTMAFWIARIPQLAL